MEQLPKGANFVRAKTLWEIGLHIAGNPATPYGGNRDMVIASAGFGRRFRPWLRIATGSAILAEGRGERRRRGGVRQSVGAADPSLSRGRPVQDAAAGADHRNYPSWDRFVMAFHPRTGIRSVADIKAKKYPLRVSVREDPTHSTIVLIDQIFALHGFTLADIEGWGGKLVRCGGPGDERRRLEPMARGEIDARVRRGHQGMACRGTCGQPRADRFRRVRV